MEQFIYTCADLEGTSAVQPCHAESGGVSGLLLHHRSGRRSCVGQVHLARLLAALEVDAAPGLSMRFSKSEEGYPYVESIAMVPEDGDGSDGSLIVQWSGLLEWWVSPWQCKIHYCGRTSPPTCRRP
jgi:hypothetical protein